MPQRDLVVESGGLALAVRDYGGEGTSLLLLHGSGGTVAVWDDFAPQLTPSFRVVAHDTPGYGLSETPAGGLDFALFLNAVDDVAAALGLDRPVLVGHSAGGMAALLYAAERSGCRAVVSIDGACVRVASDAPGAYAGEEEIAAGFGWTGSVEEFERECATVPAGPARASFRRSHVSRSDGLLEQRPTVEFMVDFTRLAASLEPELTLDDLYPAIA